uniref:SER_THR_PHOSPHATASE domain-containing protein n=1 Tax=Anisakis simplex TaxID=6269 RepID=A0A0M3J0E1_ANISI
LVIRAHQAVQDGYEIMTGRMLITVFSAPNYAGLFNNAAAVVCLDENLNISFQQLRAPLPTNSASARVCPPVACEPGKPTTPVPDLSKRVGEPTPSQTNVSSFFEIQNIPLMYGQLKLAIRFDHTNFIF